jgi:outer membrane usher protein
VLGVRNLRPVRDTSLTFSLTIPFGGPDNLHTLELTHLRQDDGRTRFEDSLATLTRALPSGPGWGYRLQASTESELRYAELDLQAGFGTYAVSVQRRGDQDRVDYSLSGGLGVIGGKFFASRQIIDSFGLASVGGVEGVRLYADGQLIGRTGPDGTVIVPTLRGYDINQLRLDPADLPMDVAVGSLKLSAVPYARSGLLVEFPVKKVRSAVLRLTLPDGTPVPAGAQARVAGVPGTFPVALEGEVFISELGPTNMLTITWAGRRCAVSVVLPDTADPLPDLGSFLCRPEAP